MNLWLRYFPCTFLYGAVHCIMDMPSEDVYTNNTNGKHEKQPVLLTHKIGYLVAGGCIGVAMWPIMLKDDVTRLECLLRGKDPSNYGRMYNIFD